MASQAKSGYAAEGTQYAVDNSFFLLDTVPGPGDVIPGPITITGNLTTTGTTVSQGALSANGVNTPAVTSSSSLTLTAQPTFNLTLAGQNISGAVPGSVNLSSAALTANNSQMTLLGPNAGLLASGTSSLVQVGANIGFLTNSVLALGGNGNASLSCSNTFSVNGTLLVNPTSGMGTPQSPVTINGNAAIVTFNMTGNKLYATITGNTSSIIYIKMPGGYPANRPPFVTVTDETGTVLTNAFGSAPLQGLAFYASSAGLDPNSWYWTVSYLGADKTRNFLVL